MEIVQVIIWVCLGATCALIAHQRGRTPIGWFFIGMLTPCIGLILVLVLPDLKKQQAEFERLRTQNRMLKERLDKDRMVADQRHGEVEGRLRAHDRVLGLDTGAAPEPRGEISAGSPPPAPGASADPAARLWYYALDSKEQGPLHIDELRPLWQSGKLGPDTLVWAKGMGEWSQISAVPGLGEVLRG
jgi:hypothetical protein